MRVYRYTTHPHVGDNIICTGAVRNVCREYEDMRFVACGEVTKNNMDYIGENDCFRAGCKITDIGKITYGSLDDEQHGRWGNVVEGFTRSLCQLLGIEQVPIRVRNPILNLTESEFERGFKWRDCILLNANCQTCSISKGYPYWQEVVNGLKGERIIQVGGDENRDISPNLKGVEDMRGKTSIRQLMVMVRHCKLVISPPSCISNIAGAFHHPQVILNASREPDVLLDYDNAVHVSHVCECGWGVQTGCISCRVGGGRRSCWRPRRVDGIDWCQCQEETPPETIIRAAQSIICK